MNAKKPGTARAWVDPDDAPELTDEFFDKGQWSINGRQVPRAQARAEIARRVGRPPVAVVRPMVSMRLDADVVQHLRASGKGWQTKVNALLREAVLQGKV